MLCKKKDIIIQKLDQLLKKLGGEELSANITMGKVSKEWKEAMEVLYSSLVFNFFMNIPSSAASRIYMYMYICTYHTHIHTYTNMYIHTKARC